MNRAWRPSRRTVVYAAVAVASALLADALLVEPQRLEVRRAQITVGVHAPLTIAHLSDLHTHAYGGLERRLTEAVRAAHPDVIVVTGDVVDDGALEPARETFEHLEAPLGVWVVRGNWENWRPPPGERAFYESVGAHLLVNEGALVRDDVWIAGTDDPMSGAASFDAALRDAPRGTTKIALFHSPEAFDRVATRFDVAFAGHTHGGQIRLPFAGPLWLPRGSGRFVDGWYESGKARMFVSRGVGTSILPLRFNCAPEIAIVTLATGP